jgi:pyruvate, orthophosphate dikinase
VILVRRETNPDDLDGMIAAEGILTSRGGRTSHAAVVARGMGKTAVSGADKLQVDLKNRKFTGPGGVVVEEGDLISIDGTTGEVFVGEVPVVPSTVVNYLEGEPDPDDQAGSDLVDAVRRLLGHADGKRRLRVRTNADTGGDAARARRFGAEGIGLCRTEHMFLGERRELVERLILAEEEDEQAAALDDLLPLQRKDFEEIFRAMDGLPVTIRLLDPPLHEFLPNLTELSVRVAVAAERGEEDEAASRLMAAVTRLHEENPMFGLRGVRLGIVVPGLFAMQVRAIAQAAVVVRGEGVDVQPEIMVPLVGAVQELQMIEKEIDAVLAEESERASEELDALIGTMIELPRAALSAGKIAEVAEFFSFGTNDLTQTAFGFSRDDIGKFLGLYEERKLVPANPFVTIDRPGVGRLMRIAAEEGRATRSELKLGICGEHGGDPDSVRFCHELGLDYVSCSPFRVPTARLAAGQAALGETTTASK